MESRVKLSTYSLILTLIVSMVVVVAGILLINHDSGIISILIVLVIVSGLLYGFLNGPISIYADKNDIIVKTLISNKKVSISDIRSIVLFTPTLGATNIIASGGFMGYWGKFREGDIGIYSVYYGKASDCFLISMKNGDKYVLGCENPDNMVNYVNKCIQYIDV